MTVRIVNIENKIEYLIECRGGNENALKCPVCSETRRNKTAKPFSYNVSKGVGHCNNCEARFVEKGNDSQRMSEEPKEYKRPVWANVTELPDKVVKWFKEERGISQQTLIDLKITAGEEFMPQTGNKENCIKFNYFRGEELINVKYRDGRKNFKLVSGAELILYNLNAIKGQKEVILVEGEIDAASWHEVGLKHAASVPNGANKGGNLAYMDNCWEYFEGVEKIYLATDNDAPGRILRDELARRLGKERCMIVDFGQYKDTNEVLKADPLSLPDLLTNAKEYPIEGLFSLKELRNEFHDMRKNGLQPGDGISINAFNELLTWVPGYFSVITGIPNHGKGEFLDQIIVDLAHFHDWGFGIFSPENRPLARHINKLASKVVGTSGQRMTDAEANEFIDQFNDRIIFIQPPLDLTLTSILDLAKTLVKKNGIRGLVIDPWNKLDHQYTSDEGRYISKALDEIDRFCILHGVHVFLVAHPYKMPKEKGSKKFEIPTLYSISGSAHWFNKPANGFCVYRNWYDDGTSDTEVHVEKVKFKEWGHRGQITLQYDYESGRYYTVGQQNKDSYLKNPPVIQTSLPLNIKPNVDFTIPRKDQEEEPEWIPGEEAPF